MTCAACAARVQARLDKVTGVIVAGATGIDEVIGEALPATKAPVIAGLQDDARSIAMVGDGATTVRPSRRPAWDWPWARALTWPSPLHCSVRCI
jgi:cation transport ATPase